MEKRWRKLCQPWAETRRVSCAVAVRPSHFICSFIFYKSLWLGCPEEVARANNGTRLQRNVSENTIQCVLCYPSCYAVRVANILGISVHLWSPSITAYPVTRIYVPTLFSPTVRSRFPLSSPVTTVRNRYFLASSRCCFVLFIVVRAYSRGGANTWTTASHGERENMVTMISDTCGYVLFLLLLLLVPYIESGEYIFTPFQFTSILLTRNSLLGCVNLNGRWSVITCRCDAAFKMHDTVLLNVWHVVCIRA